MKEEKLIELIHKRATNEITDAENQQLNTALQNEGNQVLAEQIESVWEQSLDYQKDYQPNVEAGFSKFKAQMKQENTVAPKVVQMQSRRSWLRIAAAAAILIVGGFFAWNSFQTNDWQNVAVTDTTQQINLTDGSQVQINTKSNFEYPTAFDGDQRLVRLKGEAFFDIAKNPEKPFIIESGDLNIKVLGTSFNVRNYVNENFAVVTVRSGKVEVTSANGAFTKTLTANDRLVFDKRKKKLHVVEKDDNLNDLAWWSGKIAFTSEKVSRMKEVIEHTYNVEIEFTNPEILKCDYSISNDVKAEGLESLLETLEVTLALEKVEKINKNKYQLIGGKCNF